MKTRLSYYLFTVSLLIVSLFPVMAERIDPLIYETAESGIGIFLGKIPANMHDKYGFNPEDDLAKAKLGKPFNLSVITESFVNGENDDDDVQSVSVDTTVWYFPVLIKGCIKSVLVIDKVNEQWKAVSLGYASLAKELEEIHSQWPESDGYSLLLSVNPRVKKYFFTIPENDTENLTAIDFKKKGKGRYKVLEKAKATLSLLKSSFNELRKNR